MTINITTLVIKSTVLLSHTVAFDRKSIMDFVKIVRIRDVY